MNEAEMVDCPKCESHAAQYMDERDKAVHCVRDLYPFIVPDELPPELLERCQAVAIRARSAEKKHELTEPQSLLDMALRINGATAEKGGSDE